MSTDSLSLTPISLSAPLFASARVMTPRESQAAPANEEAAAETSSEPLSKAVQELNRYVAGSRTDLRFAVDREAGKVVVSIIDAESGQVLRQMPSVEALRIARYLEHDRLGLIRQKA